MIDIKLIIIGGFLGSGKTTVLIPLALEMIGEEGVNDGSTKVAIIENEIGQVGIDTAFTGDTGLYTTELFNGCVCCSIAGSLMDSLCQIEEELHPEWVILETTGLARPGDVAGQLREYYDKDLDITIINVVDAARWYKLAGIVGSLVDEQVMSADYIFLNKTDAAEPGRVDATEEEIRAKTDARIYRISARTDKDGLTAICREILDKISAK